MHPSRLLTGHRKRPDKWPRGLDSEGRQVRWSCSCVLLSVVKLLCWKGLIEGPEFGACGCEALVCKSESVERLLEFSEQGIVCFLFEGDVDKFAYFLTMLYRVERVSLVANEQVLILEELLVIDIGLAAKHNDIAVKQFA